MNTTKTEIEINTAEQNIQDFLNFLIDTGRTLGNTLFVVYLREKTVSEYTNILKTENLKVIKGPSAFDKS